MPTASGHTTAIRASRVLGTAIFDKADAKIGKVEDVILDKTGERIMFAVIGRDGALTATEKWDGKLPPPDLLKGYRAAFINPNSKLLGPKYKFARHGQSGAELSELLPSLATVADDLTIVRSMKTDAFNHAPGQILMSTGSTIFGRPSIGAWTLYGLGSENQDLPGYVVVQSGQKGPSGGLSNFGCGFLPTVYQGVPFRSSGEPVLFLSNPKGIDDATQRDTLDVLKQLNEERLGTVGDPEIASRINSFELAYRRILRLQDPELRLDPLASSDGAPPVLTATKG